MGTLARLRWVPGPGVLLCITLSVTPIIIAWYIYSVLHAPVVALSSMFPSGIPRPSLAVDSSPISPRQ